MADSDDAAPLVDRLARADVKARLFGAPAEAARVGRFAILGPVGAGGMGVVYAAYDDELGRKIAIKLVRPGRSDPDIHARTRREAQALARLSHPNVVQVYEVGEYLGQVYVAMEFIQGKTLRAWQTQGRTWQSVVAMYQQVGHGLAAAHARGLVHRDFKPDNVLVGDDDQRPRVLDFGLARVRTQPAADLTPKPFTPLVDSDLPPAHLSLGTATVQPAAFIPDLSPGTAISETSASTIHLTPAHDLSPKPADPEQSARLTEPGAVLGTPAYMAPEQLAGGEADVRSDVFSFCVALYEALLRIRPFPGDRSDTLLIAVQRGELARPEHPPDVPAWLLRVVERGLLADPAQRWPDMDHLLAALGRDPTRRRRRLTLTIFLITLLSLSIYTLIKLLEHRQAAELAAEQARTADATAELGRARATVETDRLRSEAHRLARSSNQSTSDPTRRLLLAVEAVRVHHDIGAPPTDEADQSLYNALGNVTSTPFIPPGPRAIVDAVAESPDGTWLVTGQRSGAVTLWSTADPRHPRVLLPADDHAVRDLEFSATHLAALRDEPGGPHVWTPPFTTPPVRWDSPLTDLQDLAWSPDGRALLSHAGTEAVVLHDTTPPQLLRGHTDRIRRALWSPRGNNVLTIASDRTARLWRGTTSSVRSFDRPPTAAVFATDASAYYITHGLTLTRVPINNRGRPESEQHAHQFLGLASTPDDSFITVDREGHVRTWRAHEGTVPPSPLQESLNGVRFSADADLFLGTPPGGAVYLWQRSRLGDPLVLHGHAASVVTARFSSDDRRILTGSADGTARRWHITDDPLILRGHAAGIEHASFAADSRRVVTASMDGTTRIWPRDGAPPKLLTGHREGSSVRAAFSPDATRLATAGSDGRARLWDLRPPVPDLLATLPADTDQRAALVALEWHPSNNTFAFASEDGRVHLVHIDRPVRTDIFNYSPGHAPTTLAFDPPGQRILAAGDDGIRIWPLTEPHTPTTLAHPGPVRDLVFLDNKIVSVGDDAVVRIWPTTGEPKQLTGHTAAISQARAHPDGKTLLTASTDGTARIWPPDAAPEILTGHTDAVWLAAWSPDGAAILTASADGTARLWSRRQTTWRSTLLPTGGIPGSADPTLWTGGFSPDGRLALVAGADAVARIFTVPLDDRLTAACMRAGTDLEPDEWTRSMGDRPPRPTCP